jgi:hypothetical protein
LDGPDRHASIFPAASHLRRLQKVIYARSCGFDVTLVRREPDETVDDRLSGKLERKCSARSAAKRTSRSSS